MEVANTEHGARTEGPGVSEIKLLDLGKGAGIEVMGLVVIKTQGWKREEGRLSDFLDSMGLAHRAIQL